MLFIFDYLVASAVSLPCPIHASYSQRFGGKLPAPVHQEGTQPPRVNGLHYGFLLSLELEGVLPIRLNEKKNTALLCATVYQQSATADHIQVTTKFGFPVADFDGRPQCLRRAPVLLKLMSQQPLSVAFRVVEFLFRPRTFHPLGNAHGTRELGMKSDVMGCKYINCGRRVYPPMAAPECASAGIKRG